MTGTRPPYSGSDIRDLAKIARGRRNKHVVDSELLQNRLSEWLWTNDLVDLSQLPESEEKERQTAFREFAALEPSHVELTRTLRKLIDSCGHLSEVLEFDALPPGINEGARYLTAGKKPFHNITPEIRRTIEDGRFVGDFRDRLELLQDICTRLEVYHASHSPKNRPTKDKLSHQFYELAKIFIEVTGQDCAVQDLPRARDSIFITWASVVLKPFFERAETSRSALAARSNRLFSQ